MSTGKRKLSFLGFGGPGTDNGEDVVQLDGEMDRAVWSEADGLEPVRRNSLSPLRDEAAPHKDDPDSDDAKNYAVEDNRRVKFTGKEGPDLNNDEERRRIERSSHHLHPHKTRKYSLQEGSSVRSDEKRVSIAPAEEPLLEQDLHNINSHRTDKHRIQPRSSIVQIERKDVDDTAKKVFDRNPHAVFVQLDELLEGKRGQEWTETARWIKYEEDVEQGAARWGPPHVASLSFHSLLNLRRCLENGVVLLDLEERDLPGVAYRVVEEMVKERLIEEDDKPVVMRSLLLRHKHVNEYGGFPFSIGTRKHSSYTSLQGIGDGRRRSSYGLPREKNLGSDSKKGSLLGRDRLDSIITTESQEEFRRIRRDSILKKIPEGAEATTVLVGAVGFLDQPTIAFVRLAEGIFMPSITEVPVPVRFMFILIGPSGAELDYHEVGRSISTLMTNESFHNLAYKADDRRDLMSGINEFLDDSIVLPPGDWDKEALPFDELKAKSDMIRKRKRNAIKKRQSVDYVQQIDDKKLLLDLENGALPPKEPFDPLSRTGKIFGGAIRDMQRRYPYYLSDFKDALNTQCLSAIIFMYFAALSSAITFGGLLADKTDGLIGISETLVFTCVGGVIFALISGQPMMITGTTGPLLVLDQSLASICRSQKLDFLAARMYCGLWMIVIALVVAAWEGSSIVKRITRFTQDIFAFLISLIFISEPISALFSLYRAHPLGVDYCANNNTNNTMTGDAVVPDFAPKPNTALFGTMITIITFVMAYYLRIFRNGKFLGRTARRALGDFGVPITIVIVTVVANYVPVWTETLRVPDGLSPTAPRSWFVFMNPGLSTISWSAAILLVIPALMVYMIVFLETHIAEIIIGKPERKLKKGSGLHLDVVVMAIVNALCGLTGAPWQCVATVRSVSHAAALTVFSSTHAPGEKPHIVEVKEQRVTGLLVSVAVGLSVLASGFLRVVPMTVLFGIFLYMGISALGGIQFWERCILLFKPVKHHPQVPYVRRVPMWKMHMYTLIQVAAVIGLSVLKYSQFSLILPFVVGAMVPLRMSLVFCFTPLQLRALDGDQKEIDQDDEPDFYQEAPLSA